MQFKFLYSDIKGCCHPLPTDEIQIDYPLLTSLDVSAVLNLFQIQINHPLLTSLDVPDVSNLFHIQIDHPLLTSLDVLAVLKILSEYNLITHYLPPLMYLLCYSSRFDQSAVFCNTTVWPWPSSPWPSQGQTIDISWQRLTSACYSLVMFLYTPAYETWWRDVRFIRWLIGWLVSLSQRFVEETTSAVLDIFATKLGTHYEQFL